MPSSSFTLVSSPKTAVTQDEPRPRARRATQKLHAAWMTESNRPGRPLPSCRPMIVTMTSAGTSARCAARKAADAITFSCGCPVPASRSALAAIHGLVRSLYKRARPAFTAGSRTISQRRLPRLPRVGACSAMSMQSSRIWLSTSRPRSSRRRTARVVDRAASTCAASISTGYRPWLSAGRGSVSARASSPSPGCAACAPGPASGSTSRTDRCCCPHPAHAYSTSTTPSQPRCR
jgi:hypothetical protein